MFICFVLLFSCNMSDTLTLDCFPETIIMRGVNSVSFENGFCLNLVSSGRLIKAKC